MSITEDVVLLIIITITDEEEMPMKDNIQLVLFRKETQAIRTDVN